MANALAGTDHTIDLDTLDDEIGLFDISDAVLEAAAGMELSPHKTGCSSYCPAHSCGCIAWAT